MGFDLQAALARIEKEKNDRPELREEKRIKGPYRIPLSQINRRSRVGSIAHLANENGWDSYVYECVNFTGDTLMKSGGIKRGKEEAYTWTVGKINVDGKWYVYKYSDLVCWVNKVGYSYDELKQFITGNGSANLFP